MLPGCRSLRPQGHIRSLTQARAASLMGAGMLQQQNFTEAGALFSEALSHSDADDRAHRGIAEVYWHESRNDLAIAHMTRAAELSGQNPDLLVRLGEMHFQQGDMDKALGQADQALKMSRQHAAAWALKGLVLRAQNLNAEAIDCYHRALLHEPDFAEAQIALADIYQSLGRSQRALATIDQLAERTPTETIPASAWLVKGRALAALGEPVDSKDCLREAALCAREDESELLLDLAQMQYQTGDLAEARLSLGKVLHHNPQDPHALQFQHILDEAFQSPGDAHRVPAFPVSQIKEIPSLQP